MQQDDNLNVYELPDVVETYLHHNALTKAELILFKENGGSTGGRHVLDIGVGAGRTTEALAANAASYLGIDYSKAMVETCRERFRHLGHARFGQDDARLLASCPDASFDIAVFSFNGIDTMPPRDRPAVLSAAYRVLRPGGRLIFSFHNAWSVPAMYRYRWQKNPLRWYSAYQRLRKIKVLNGPSAQYAGREVFLFKDGAEDFRMDICYVTPSYQLRELEQNGFTLQAAYESLSGKLLDTQCLQTTLAPWIYFVCSRRS